MYDLGCNILQAAVEQSSGLVEIGNELVKVYRTLDGLHSTQNLEAVVAGNTVLIAARVTQDMWTVELALELMTAVA